jgi:uncharacterized protein YuzB (UPF0349 family)
MTRSPKKLPLLLLALLLAFSPLQNAFAGLDFHMTEKKAQPGMNHADTGGMSMHGYQGMNADCQHCDEQIGCNEHDCSLTHCASCVPGLLSFVQQNVIIAGNDTYPPFKQILTSCFTSHLFRPPKR